jgi:hypothetical protein
MKVSNLRKITDPTTFEPSVVVDVEIPRMTLYELTLMKEDIRKDIIYTIGAELLEQIVVQMGMTDEQKKELIKDLLGVNNDTES